MARKVLIGTPAYSGTVDVWYANSLVNTVRMSYEKDVVIVPVYMAYDSLVQRARNDLVKLAIEEDFDDLIFIDADQDINNRGFPIRHTLDGTWGQPRVSHLQVIA
jgi:hypothetical protein